MLKFFRPLLKKLAEMLENLANPPTLLEEENTVIEEVLPPEGKKKKKNPLQKRK
jgi:hypothetical protein